MKHFKTLTLLGALAMAATVMAQTPIAPDGRVEAIGMPRMGLNSQDAKFIKDAAASNTFEVRSSQLALMYGQSAFVKQFAKEMIADHSAAYEELKLIVDKKERPVSKTLPPKLQAVINKLSRLRGAAFDAAYELAQKEAHADTAMKLEKQIQGGRDEDLKSYAIKTLPAVKMHSRMLAMKKTMTGPTKMEHNM